MIEFVVGPKHNVPTVQMMGLSTAAANPNQSISSSNQHSRADYGRRME